MSSSFSSIIYNPLKSFRLAFIEEYPIALCKFARTQDFIIINLN